MNETACLERLLPCVELESSWIPAYIVTSIVNRMRQQFSLAENQPALKIQMWNNCLLFIMTLEGR